MVRMRVRLPLALMRMPGGNAPPDATLPAPGVVGTGVDPPAGLPSMARDSGAAAPAPPAAVPLAPACPCRGVPLGDGKEGMRVLLRAAAEAPDPFRRLRPPGRRRTTRGLELSLPLPLSLPVSLSLPLPLPLPLSLSLSLSLLLEPDDEPLLLSEFESDFERLAAARRLRRCRAAGADTDALRLPALRRPRARCPVGAAAARRGLARLLERLRAAPVGREAFVAVLADGDRAGLAARSPETVALLRT